MDEPVNFSKKEKEYISSYYFEIKFILDLFHKSSEDYLKFRRGKSMSSFVDDMKQVNKEFIEKT